MQLDGQVAIVTGAGRGIGRGVALGLAAEGAHVVVADIDAGAAARVVGEIGAQGYRRALVAGGDVSSAADVDWIVSDAMAAFGRIDILVNNAAVSRRAQIMEVTEADWDRIMTINAKGVFLCLQRVAREMILSGGGRIINVASIGGKGFPGVSSPAYAASKGAVLALTRTAAQQLARHDITVNAICPGTTRGGDFDEKAAMRASREGITLDELMEKRTEMIPLGRINEPEDIAAMVVFLAARSGRNITGQSYNVDGGLVMD